MSDLVVRAEIDVREAFHVFETNYHQEESEPDSDRRRDLIGGLPDGTEVGGSILNFRRFGEDYTLTREKGRFVLYANQGKFDLGRTPREARASFNHFFNSSQ